MEMTRENWQLYAMLKKYVPDPAAAKNFKSNHKVYTPRESVWQLVTGDYDGYLEKTFFPHYFSNSEKIGFDQMHRIEAPSGPYDCTGKPFTSWLKFFETSNGTWIYHKINFDV